MTDIKTLEKIIDRFVPCMCSFTKGFAYDKNTKCDCDNSEAKQALNLYIEERERLARIDEVNELDKFLDNQKAVGAVRAWSLQRKQMIKSELEG